MKKSLVNYVAFQAGWFACVIGAANGLPIIGLVVVLLAVLLHLSWATRPLRELQLLAICALIGLTFDSMLLATGWISYPNSTLVMGLAPPWIVAMWVIFGSTLNLSMSWLRGRSWLAAIFGAIGGPLSYLAGQKLGAISLLNQSAALVTLAVGWAIILPLITALATHFDGFKKAAVPGYIQSNWRKDNVSNHG